MNSQDMDGFFEGIDRLPLETWPDHAVRPRSFYGAPLCSDLDELDAQVAFLGVPLDLGMGPSAPAAGARGGPNSVRNTGGFPATVYSCSSIDGTMTATGYYDVGADRQCLAGITMADCGDVSIVPADVERNLWRVTRTVQRIVSKGPLLVTIGGDQTITSAAVRGFRSYGAVDMVHFDAHSDFGDHVQGIRWTSSSPIRRCSEFPWVRDISQIGLRAARNREQIDAARARGYRIVSADRFRELGADAAMKLVPESGAMYVTIDVDVLDPSVCPGVGVPEPGGLTYVEMRDALRALARRGRVVGIDVVGITPVLDPTGITSKTASKLIMDFLDAVFDSANPMSRSQVSPPSGATT